jgi:dipeptidyl aminopeptidase/acylaminoacyl peptidase
LDERAQRATKGIRRATAQVQVPSSPIHDRDTTRGRRQVTLIGAALATAVVVLGVVALGQKLVGSAHDGLAAAADSRGVILFGQWNPDAQESSWFTIRADGTGEKSLHVRATCARWFPDRSKILISNDARVDVHLPLRPATINPDGSDLRPLNGARDIGLNLGCGDVSPDGSTIAVEGFNDGRPSVNGIYLVSATDGGHLRRITHSPAGGSDGDPKFAPDRRQIIFLRSKPGLGTEGAGTLYVATTTGASPRRITPAGFAFLGYDWSPDGQWIAFQRPYGQLYVVHPDGSGLRRIRLRLPSGAGAQNPAWSPDSRSIVFSLRSGGHASLYVVNVDGSGLRRLTTGSATEDQTPDWAP